MEKSVLSFFLPTTRPRSDWIWRSLVCGYLASVIVLSLLMATYITLMMTNHAAAGSAGWPHALVQNALSSAVSASPCAALALHFITGITFALLYGYLVEPQQADPDRRSDSVVLRGVRFAMIPCALSLVVFFPLVGAGPFGLYLGAGPLPVIGNIILHAVFGASLALLYGPMTDRVLFLRHDHNPEVVKATVTGSYRGGSLGLVIGSIIGLAVGSLSFAVAEPNAMMALHLPNTLLPLTLLLIGSSFGCLIGVVLGMPELGRRPIPRQGVIQGKD